MLRRLLKTLRCLLIIVTGCALGFIAFVSGIAVYAEFIIPTPVKSTIVAEKLAECFRMETFQLDCLVGPKILTPGEIDILQTDSSVSRQVVWRIVLPAYGIYPYPAEVYSDLPFSTTADDPAEQPYVDARAAAVICGLASSTQDPTAAMSEQEFDVLIQKLDSGTISLPEYNIDCPYLQGHTWNAETYRGRNALLSAWEDIPVAWRTDFIAEGWQIDFTLPSEIETEQGLVSRDHAAGSIHYAGHIIHLDTSNPKTTLHEFGHYVTYRVGWLYDPELEAEFQTEGPVLAELLGKHSQESPREYIAEFIAHWLAYPDEQVQLAELAPNTTTRAKSLIYNYESLLPTEAP